MKNSLLIGLVSLLLLTACGGAKTVETPSAKKLEPKTIKIGVVTPLSGDVAVYGTEIKRVLDYQLAKINTEAAKSNRKIELVLEDGKCSGSEAVTAFQKLTDIDGVKMIQGGFCSSETLAMAPLAQAKGIPLVSAASSNPDIEKEGDMVFTLSYPDDAIGKELAAELGKYSRVALITEQNDFNIGIQKVVREALKGYPKVKVAADETFPKGSTDFRNMLEKIAKAKPEAVLLNPNPGVTAQNLLKQVSEIPAFKEIKLVGQVAYLADDLRNVAKAAAEGMVIIDAPKLTDPKVVRVMAEIKQAQGSTDNLGVYYTASMADSLNLLADLALRFDGDPLKIKQALRSESFSGLIGSIRFGDSNFVQGIGAGRYVVQDGKAVYQQ